MRYCIINNLGAPYGASRFFNPFSIAGAIGGIASTLMTNDANRELSRWQMEQQQRYNERNMQLQDQYNRNYQRWLNQTQYGYQVSGMRNAGLNPAGANTSLGAMQGSNAISSANPSANPVHLENPIGASMQAMSTLSQLQLQDEEVESKHIENESKRLDLINKKAENDESRSYNVVTTPDGTLIARSDDPDFSQKLESWISSHPNEDPQFSKVMTEPGEIGRRKGRLRQQEDFTLSQSLSRDLANYQIEKDDFRTRTVVNKLERLVTTKKLNSKTYADTLAMLPDLERKKILATIKNMNADTSLKSIQKELTKRNINEFDSTSYSALINSIKDSDMSVLDKILAVIGFISTHSRKF